MKNFTELFQDMMLGNPVHIPDNGYLAGWIQQNINWKKYRMFFEYDNMHYPMGNAFLKYGISGVLDRFRVLLDQEDGDKSYIECVISIYGAVLDAIAKHLDKAQQLYHTANENVEKDRLREIITSCSRLMTGPPVNFLQGMQLFYFMYLFRGPFGRGCIGRLDQKLYPCFLYEKQRPDYSEEWIITILMEFFGKLNEIGTGDTLRNLMLSGQDEEGRDETNELTYLIMEAYLRKPDAEPHLNVRLHGNSPEKLWNRCADLLLLGAGQPTIYFDDCIIPYMEQAGIPGKTACNYANDGCTETVIDGESSIFFLQHEMVKTVELTLFNGRENPCIYPTKMKKSSQKGPEMEPVTGLHTGYVSGEVRDMVSFGEVYQAFERQLDYQLQIWLRKIDERIREDETYRITSPFLAGTLEAFPESGQDPLRGGFSVPNYQLLSGTIGTAADCLRGVEAAVFEQKWCSMYELLKALSVNFEGYEVLRQKLLQIPKYGNGDRWVDEIAAAIGRKFVETVNSYTSSSGKKVWPGLYNIDFKIFAHTVGASPDGRKFLDPIGEHCSPTPGAARSGPTAIIESASSLPMGEGYAASPLYLTLDKGGFTAGADGKVIIRSLLEGARAKGIPILNITMYRKEELKKAQEEPERYGSLIVRVWGYNARFVELDKEMQDHIIQRISL